MVNSPPTIEGEVPQETIQGLPKEVLTSCHQLDLASDDGAWHHTIHQAVTECEEDRSDTLKDKGQRRKARATSAATPEVTFTCRLCRHCPRICLCRIG